MFGPAVASPMPPALHSEPRAIEPRVFRLAADKRRSAIYVLVGSFVIVATGAAVNVFLGRPPESACGLVVFMIGAAVLVAAAYHWRIRIDERGIVACTLGIRRAWLWDDMLAGKIVCRSLLHFEHAQPRLFGRRLNLEWLEPAEAHYVSRLCRIACAQPPDEKPLPEEMVFRDQWNRVVRCTAEGMHLPRGNGLAVPWQSIQSATIARAVRESTEFLTLEIRLDGRTIRATAVQQWAVLPANDRSVIAAYLMARISSDRLTVVSLGDPPETVRESDSLLAENGERLLTFQRMLFWWPVAGTAIAFLSWPMGISHMLIPTLLLTAKYQYIFWLMGSPARKRQLLLVAAKEALLAGRQPDASDPRWTRIDA